MEATLMVPPWIESLLSTTFFSVCRTHKDVPRNECNMYCLHCRSTAFCFYCQSSQHKDHLVIQIRRSSYHNVVRVAEIEKVLDISAVQTYVINSARVVFLNERPQPRSSGKGASYTCEICARSLLDPFRFCSLGCKLVGIKTDGSGSFMLNTTNNGNVVETREEKEALREGSQHDRYACTPPPLLHNSRRRKGTPHRAPLGS